MAKRILVTATRTRILTPVASKEVFRVHSYESLQSIRGAGS